jgi:hypothetical protein
VPIQEKNLDKVEIVCTLKIVICANRRMAKSEAQPEEHIHIHPTSEIRTLSHKTLGQLNVILFSWHVGANAYPLNK